LHQRNNPIANDKKEGKRKKQFHSSSISFISYTFKPLIRVNQEVGSLVYNDHSRIPLPLAASMERGARKCPLTRESRRALVARQDLIPPSPPRNRRRRSRYDDSELVARKELSRRDVVGLKRCLNVPHKFLLEDVRASPSVYAQ